MAPYIMNTHKIEVSESSSIMIYQIWPGKNRFFFSGRLMLGPSEDLKPFCITLLLLVILELMFILFICPYLWYEVTIMIPILSLQLFVLSLFFMFFTMIIDPGIIPRKEIFLAIGEVPQAFATEGEEKKKFCKTCQIFKPARSNHCSRCDNCVEIFDHHCPFINSCIGKNNYKYFVVMVTSLSFLGGMNMAGLFLFMFYDSDRVRASRSRNVYSVIKNNTFLLSVAVVLTLSITFLTILVFCLCMFHMKITISGETTKEHRLHLKQVNANSFGNEKFWFHPRLLIQSG